MTVRDAGPLASVRRVVDVGGVLLLAVVVAPFLAYMVPQLVGASQSYVVVSESMNAEPAPVLEAGDVVFVYDTPPEAIEQGDVITYRSGDGQVTTHRVVGVETSDGRAFETKGDANEEADPSLVPAERVVGTVEFSVPFVGRVVMFAGTSVGLVFLLILPAGLLVVTELHRLVQVVREPGPGEDTDS